MKSILIKKIGTMDSGKFLCAIDKREWASRADPNGGVWVVGSCEEGAFGG